MSPPGLSGPFALSLLFIIRPMTCQRLTAAEVLELVSLRSLMASGAARAIREGAGISLSEAAQSCGTYPSTILRWERKEQVPHGHRAVEYGRLLVRLMERQ